MLKNNIKFIVFFIACFVFQNQSFAQQGTVTVDQDSDIDKLLDYKKDVKTVNLYKIQIYSGDRFNAENTKKNFLNSFGEWPVEMVYEQPNTKIQVGKFRSRLEADKALLKIKKKYSNAFIFEPKKDKK
ncbi:SPOR domain-containing protein [uncultured Psychroserpens sp.]|uniref:SPOR domain-containing protein n=1 Tax=uncultured Psychroserpens sp. TaxID=255436 RepID=UPI00260ECEC4|nr:SPOR domain-containing protein [uncultured Psychroserpens sp.]